MLRNRRVPIILAALMLSVGLLAPGMAWSGVGTAHAATLTVTTTADSGAGSLREAIANAAPGDTISFDSTVKGAIKLTSGQPLTINKNLTISGPGATALAIDGNSATAIFYLADGNVGISGLTLQNGLAQEASGGGGALYVSYKASLTLSNSTVANNKATLGYSNGGAIHNSGGKITINNSAFFGNVASYVSGAIENDASSSLTISNSTFSGNSASDAGGAIGNFGGKISLSNSTIANNTLSGGRFKQGGGIYNGQGSVVSLTSTIIAQNVGAGGADFFGAAASKGNNLIGTTTGLKNDLVASDQFNIDAGLSALALNAPGTTQTMALKAGSPAIGAGSNCGQSDQRGVSRQAACDVGAYQSQAIAALTHINGSILFLSNRDGKWGLYRLDSDEQHVTQLATVGSNPVASRPALSPDGKHIAFISDRDGKPAIYVMNANGTGLRRLTNNAALNYQPTWSPDSKQILYASNLGNNTNLYTVNADGSNVVQLTHSLSDLNEQGAWSPDGKQILFASGKGTLNLSIMAADGTGAKQLTVNGRQPSWSPDGKQIAFVSTRDGSSQIYVMKADGSNVQRLTNNKSEDATPSWSPDGKQIVFVSTRDGNSQLYVMNTDGSNVQRLTNNDAQDQLPMWIAAATGMSYIPLNADAFLYQS